jgi:hypothetical protein
MPTSRPSVPGRGLPCSTATHELSEAEHEVILRVVEKRIVPRERVRLDKETVTGEERVAEEVRLDCALKQVWSPSAVGSPASRRSKLTGP